eukprot:21653-Chlamydomonas_euryale.AAC.2
MEVDNAGPRRRSSPPPALVRCPGWQLLLKLRGPRRPFPPPMQSASFCVDCTNAAPIRDGITPWLSC